LNININEEKESFRAPVDLIECKEINCDKTFTSERALQYQARHSHLISLLGNERNRSQKYSELNYQAFGSALKNHKNLYMKDHYERANVFPLKIINPSQMSSKKGNISIAVKMEFNNGQKQNRANDSEIQDC